MRKDKNSDLEMHFQNLKEMLPELGRNQLPRNISEKLYSLLKSSLSVVEAVYLQHPESFSTAKVEAYTSIIADLKKLGITYRGNEELLSKTAGQLIMGTKMPMERAGKRKKGGEAGEKKVG